MAIFHPEHFPETSPSSERKVRRALEDLAGDWHVFHSVAWQAPRAGKQGDGEADFVLLHPRMGILVLEVKGGRIDVEDGAWFSVDRSGIRHPIKDPFRQATDSKHALLRYLKDVRSLESIPSVHHAVVFPDVVVTGSIGLYPREIVLDAEDLASAVQAVERVMRHWGAAVEGSLSSTALSRIIGLLAPTVRVSAMLRAGMAVAERALVSLTLRQFEVLGMLRSVRRCVVRGGAGTGKSLLAVENARRMSSEGAKTLLVAFNVPATAQLASSLRNVAGATVSTFHSLCVRWGRNAGLPVPTSPGDEWFSTRAADVLVEASTKCGEDDRYDALLVDEAQDLSDEWLTALLLLLRHPDEGPVRLFLDHHQQIYRAALAWPTAWPVFELDLNCRNTLPIARVVAGCFSDPAPSAGADGPDVSFVEGDDPLMVEIVHDVVRRLTEDEGLAPRQIAVLSNTRSLIMRLRTMLVGQAAFVELGRDGVVGETIQRFKGLESEAVVLVLTGAPSTSRERLDRALLYVGLSRARSALFVVGTAKWIHWCKAFTARGR